MKRFATVLIGMIVFAPTVGAQGLVTPPVACADEMVERLQVEHDTYRQVLFGSTAKELHPDNKTVLKTGGVISDDTAEDKKGIFETKQRMTSELVEPATEALRTFRCETMRVCDALINSMGVGANVEEVDTQPLGCSLKKMPVMTQCVSVAYDSQATLIGIRDYCQDTVSKMLRVEQSVLKLAVAYDAGYRWMLQMTGMFDQALKEAPTRTFLTLRQMVGLLGKLHQIPCYIGQCDMPPPAN